MLTALFRGHAAASEDCTATLVRLVPPIGVAARYEVAHIECRFALDCGINSRVTSFAVDGDAHVFCGNRAGTGAEAVTAKWTGRSYQVFPVAYRRTV